MNLDPKLLERAITPKTKAVMPVHLYGQPFDLDPILAICKKHKLPLVEDTAQAHAAKYKGKIVAPSARFPVSVFIPAKISARPAKAARSSRTTRNSPSAPAPCANTVRPSVMYHDEVGFNYRMEGIQGAVLGVKLPHLQKWTDERRRVAHRYHELLKDTPLQLPTEAAGCDSAYHLYVVRHPQRDKLKEHLDANGVGCALHYPVPLHLQKCYAKLGYKPGDFPVAEKAARECLSLPIYPELTDAQIQRWLPSSRISSANSRPGLDKKCRINGRICSVHAVISRRIGLVTASSTNELKPMKTAKPADKDNATSRWLSYRPKSRWWTAPSATAA